MSHPPTKWTPPPLLRIAICIAGLVVFFMEQARDEPRVTILVFSVVLMGLLSADVLDTVAERLLGKKDPDPPASGS